jgi:RHS repeat-associated protein
VVNPAAAAPGGHSAQVETRVIEAEPPTSPQALTGIEDLLYSTYLGGYNYQDLGFDVEYDDAGMTYVVGTTSSADFPLTPGAFDHVFQGINEAFVAKIDPAASGISSLVYSTFLGGSLSEVGYGIAVSPSGDGTVYVVGTTGSSDFPTTDGAYDRALTGRTDIFVARLASGGNALLYSTYLGGTDNDLVEADWGLAIAVDPSGSGVAYVTGSTISPDFPTTDGAYDRTLADTGCGSSIGDAYVTALNGSGSQLVHSTYVGGACRDRAYGIAIGPTGGDVFLTGQTYSSDFPTTPGAFDRIYNQPEGFAFRLNSAGSDLVYSTFLGGSTGTEARAIAVDSVGNAYITGQTWSADFATSGAFQTTRLGNFDAFGLKLDSLGSSRIWATYLGGGPGLNGLYDYLEIGYGITVDVNGYPTVTGYTTSSYNFPTTEGAFHTTGNIFLTRLTSDGAALSYSALFGGSSDIGYGIGQNPDGSGDVAVTGITRSSGFPTTTTAYDRTYNGGGDTFVSVIALGPTTGGGLPDNAIFSRGGTVSGTPDCRGCGLGTYEGATGDAGDPIDTRTGNFDYSISDLAIETASGPLVFQRSYASLAIDTYTSLLGFGWTHNHETRLIFPGDPGGQAGAVLFKAHSANQYTFTDNGNGTYSPIPGVLASLVRNPGPPVTFTLNDPGQATYIFSETGRLLSWSDAQGRTWSYTYDGNNRLDRVTDTTSGRYLDFDYDPQGRIERVADHTGRDVTFGYDANGDLTTVTDVLDQTWTYVYDSAHRLRQALDPESHQVVRTEYDAQGRAYQQYDASDTLVLQVTYNPDGTTTILDALGNQTAHAYDDRSTLTGTMDDLGNGASRTYDPNFRPDSLTDENDNTIHLIWSTDGTDLTQVIDAEGDQVDLTYDDLNNLRTVADGRRYTTTYTYNETDPDPDRRTLLLSVEDPLDNLTTYTYTTAADFPQPPGLLKTISDPNGHTTQFVYNEFGQRIQMIDPLSHSTYYSYDSLGRLHTTRDPLNHVTWTCYDATGRVVRAVANASGDGGSPQTDPCNASQYVPSSDPDKDRVATTVYDTFGNPIATIDPAGVITRTYYDFDNRPEVVVQNLTGQAIEVETPPAYNPAYPDRNVRTTTTYDDQGNPIAVTDNAGIITRIYYDTLNRPEHVVVNLVGQGIAVGTPPAYNPSYPDRNVRSQTVYDDAGNVIATIETLGRITRTYYDANNQPVTVVQNLVGQGIEVETPPARSSTYSDRNLRTDTTYDANGNAIAVTDPLGIITRTYYDAANRPQYVVQNLVGQGIGVETPPAYDPQYPDRNVRTEYIYDDAGTQIAVRDPNGVITRTYHDDANRPVTMVQNLVGQTVENPTPPARNPATPDENVRTDYYYDDAGNQIAVRDPNEVITRAYYDGLGRVRYVVQNLTGQGIEVSTPPPYNPAYPDQNVRIETIYDANGDAIATIDNAGVVTRMYYDDLHRAVSVVQNLVGQTVANPNPPARNPSTPDENVRTDTVYGDRGEVVRTLDALDHTTASCYDGQGRVVKAIVNPSVGSPCGSYTPSAQSDLDLITLTTYDGMGNRLSVTDPNGKQTSYAYDDVDRLEIETDPLSHVTGFGYDGNGNRISATDAEGVVISFEHDALGRLTAVTENYRPGFTPNHEINVRTEYAYDAAGNRRTIRDGNTHTTTFTYDDLRRLTGESDALGHAWAYGYDEAGNRVSILDADGFTTVFGYDDLGRLTSIDYPAPDADVSFTYNAAGERATMGDGVGSTQWQYDDLRRPTSITDPFSGVVGYGYDEAGNRTALSFPGSHSVSYVYDDAGRLEVVTDWDSLVTSYTWDRGGWPATVALPNGMVSAYTFDDAGRLQSLTHASGGTTLSSLGYTYDDVGNRLTAQETLQQPSTSSSQMWVADTGSNRGVLYDVASVTDGENAVDLLGQYDAAGGILYNKSGANDGPNTRGFNAPYASALDSGGHRLFVSDTSNNRVLVFTLDASNQLTDRVADAVLGQPDLTSRATSLTATGMNAPRGLAFDATGNRLFVADTGYHRVLIFDVAAITNGEAAVNVLGQTSFTAGSSGLAQNRLNGAQGVAFAGTLLYVADTANNRVMVFDVASITNGENAVHVLGQSNFTTSTAGTSQTKLRSPRGVAVGGSNRLFVADTTNNRVMVFDVAAITDGEAAINVLGQSSFTTSTAATSQSGMRAPEGVVADASSRLFVGDSSNHRVTVYDIATITNGEAAVNVLGQTSYTAGSSGLAQNRLNTPYGVSLLGSLLHVADANNRRLMIFDVAAITNGENAVNLAGQLGGGLAPLYTKNGADDAPNTQGLNLSGAFADYALDPVGHRLFASDPTNHRVLVFDLNAANELLDHVPDAVLGQTDFWSGSSAVAQNRFNSPRDLLFEATTNWLFVADYSNNRVLVFDVASITNGENAVYVLGQANFTSGTGATAQNRLKNPVGLALDTSRGWLFVGDYSNHRVMVFDVNTITNGENAIYVLGQSSFTTATAATSQTGLRNPSGVAIDVGGSRLFVADTNNHRVMVFNVAAITNGEAAANVLGQASFTTATAATTQSGMRNPQGVVVDEELDRLFVADTNNHRVTLFDVASISNGENAIHVLGQANFTSGSSATAQNRLNAPSSLLIVASTTVVTTTITYTYTYDPLYRLTAADYDGGASYFRYTYDAVGNRVTEVTPGGSVSYTYDIANRMTSVGGVPYTWSPNGNLLSDGTYTYAYDYASRLTSATWGTLAYGFAYNGLGDRLRQTVNGTPTNYTLDLQAGLTQVLAAGTNAYLYGNGRIGEEQPAGWAYHLGDALGSVRQLANASGGVTLARAYEPFGDLLSSVGTGTTIYAFTGEQRDGTGLVYLRARYYGGGFGRFLSRDIWEGDPNQPMSYNAWLYVFGNPVNLTDPTGTYATNLHLHRTLEWAEEVASVWCPECLQLPGNWLGYWIAQGDEHVDSRALDSLSHPEFHFVSYEEARSELHSALETADPFLFGAALHQLQDYWSHTYEGYGQRGGHAYDSFLGGCDVEILAHVSPCQRLPNEELGILLSLWVHGEIASPNREALASRLGYLGAGVRDLTTSNLFDVWLREYPGGAETRRAAYWKDLYGYDTDSYYPFTWRDRQVERDTRLALHEYFEAARANLCLLTTFGYVPPDDEEIVELLE